MILVLAATIAFSFTAPDSSDSSKVCGRHAYCPADRDTCRVLVMAIPTGQFFRYWRDTIYCARRQHLSKTYPAPILDNHLVITRTQKRLRGVYPTQWVEMPCSKSVICKPKP